MGRFAAGFLLGGAVSALTFLFLQERSEEAPRREQAVPEARPAESARPQPASSEGDPSRSPGQRGLEEPSEPGIIQTAVEESVSGFTMPITLPPEFDWLVSDPGFVEFQRRPIDAASVETEAEISRFFAERPELTAVYGFPTIHCRTRACEVLVVASGDESSVKDEFAQALRDAEIVDQPWFNQLWFSAFATRSRDGVVSLRYELRDP